MFLNKTVILFKVYSYNFSFLFDKNWQEIQPSIITGVK